MTTVHKNLTGADLHEPKGADTALSGQVYVANGSGSGVWTAASSVVTNTAFTTGDTKATFKTVVDTGWIFWSSGSTIGDGSSGATNRANADTSALFTLLWTNFNDTNCPVSTGRGASAAADFAAHKTIGLPPGSGRAIGITGSGSGLTSRALGDTTGTETKVLLTANLPPYTPSGSVGPQLSFTYTAGSNYNVTGSSFGVATIATVGLGNTVLLSAQTFTGSAQGGTSTAFSIMQPTVFMNIMIKL